LASLKPDASRLAFVDLADSDAPIFLGPHFKCARMLKWMIAKL
jgi:hypothetical protein